MAIAAALSVALIGGCGARSTQPGVVPAQRIVDSMGVMVHLGYLDTAYARFPAIVERLKALGIGLVRDGPCAGCTVANARLAQLERDGIRTDLIIGSPSGQYGPLPELLAIVRRDLAGSAVSLEGPNEYDNFGDLNWVAHLRSYQEELYRAVKSDPLLRHIPVIAPSFAHPQSFAKVGDLGAVADAANVHSYPPYGGPPDVNVDAALIDSHIVAAGKPVVATETGYRTAGPPLPFSRPVSEPLEAAYLPALYLEYFRSGIQRTFVYELVDEKPDPRGVDPEQHFGLLHNDLSPKPAYRAIRNLVTLLSAGGPAAGALRPPDGQLAGVSGRAVHSLVAQRGDGAQVVAVWPTLPDPRLTSASSPAAFSPELRLRRSASVELYRPALSSRPQSSYSRVTHLVVPVRADPVLLVIHPPS